MTAYEQIQAWIAEGKENAFPPLDAEGYSRTMAGGGMVFLYCAPGEGSEDLSLYAPLISLAGVDGDDQLEFLWDLAEANMVGALPGGYRLFADREDFTVYLGCQCACRLLDYTAFHSLMEAFIRYAAMERERMGAELEEMSGLNDVGDAYDADAPRPSAPETSANFVFNPGFIRG